jgi:hypothetical protein
MQQACGIIAQNTLAAEVECSAAATADQALVVFMFFVLFMPFALFLLVTPFPVFPLVLRPEMIVICIIVIAFRQPLAVRPIFARVPIVIVPIFLVVCPTLVLLLFVPFVVVLGPRHGQRPHWCHKSGRQEKRNRKFMFTTHTYPPETVQDRCPPEDS